MMFSIIFKEITDPNNTFLWRFSMIIPLLKVLLTPITDIKHKKIYFISRALTAVVSIFKFV